MCKEFADSPEVEVELLKRPITSCAVTNDLPQVVSPKGLDAHRQWYLYEQVRPFCHSNLAKDITCPKPAVPKFTQSACGSELTSKSTTNPGEHSASSERREQHKQSAPKSRKRQKTSDSSTPISLPPRKQRKKQQK